MRPPTEAASRKELKVQKYLVCYDYGTGGVWLYIEAESPSQIEATYRDLKVFEAPPAWLTPDEDAQIRSHVGPLWDTWLAQFRR
jgi:hypothetical protein